MEERTVQEAILHGDCKKLLKCLKRGVTLEERESALKEVCVLGYDGLVPLLLEDADVDVNKIYEDGFTLLSIASSQGCSRVVQELLDHGADVNLGKKNGWFPLMTASKNGHTEVVRVLLENGAQINMQKQNGRTALMSASQNGHSEVVRVLLDNDAQVDLQMKNGSSALILASEDGHSDIVRQLLESGAQLNLQAMHKSSPLSQEEQSELEVAPGSTALMVAREKGHTEVVRILQDHSTRPGQDSTSLTKLQEEVANQTGTSNQNVISDNQQLDRDWEDLASSDGTDDLLKAESPSSNELSSLNAEPPPEGNDGSENRHTPTINPSLETDSTEETNNANGIPTVCLVVAIATVFLAILVIMVQQGLITRTMHYVELKSNLEVTEVTSSSVQLVSTPSMVSSIRSLNSKPQMMDLVHMESTSDEEGLQILQEIEQDCKRLGYLLGLKDRLVVNIWSKSVDPAAKCEELMGEWLSGKGSASITWDTFIDAVEKVNLRVLADKLRQQLKSDSQLD